MKKSKTTLRAYMRDLRRSRPAAELARLSAALQDRLRDLEIWKRAQAVALYVSRPEEAGTHILLEEAWRTGKIVLLPRLIPGRPGEMGLALCRGKTQLRTGPYGILEPDPAVSPWAFLPGRSNLPEAAEALPWPELLLLPGLAFDRQGGRLGHGGGYYDRFLAGKDCRCLLMGWAYAFQVVEKVPMDPWDQPMAALCTENEYIGIAQGSGEQCVKNFRQ